MAKTMLGIDIGHDRLKLALVNGRKVKKTAVIEMPDNLIRDGRPISIESFGELLRTAVKEKGMRTSSAAVILSGKNTFVRSVTMPVMTDEQLRINLPYEFRDYITDDLRNYVFDYAMITDTSKLIKGKSKEAMEQQMEVLAAAAPVEYMNDLRMILRKAGMKMEMAAPVISSYVNLIRNAGLSMPEYCIIDLGYTSIRMYVFKGDVYTAGRELEGGLRQVDQAISDAYNVDEHLAHTYLVNNYDDCQQSEIVNNAFGSVSVELLRAVNFYRFSNPDSQLKDVFICGGGAKIRPLADQIRETLDMDIHYADELIGHDTAVEDPESLLQAIGIAENA